MDHAIARTFLEVVKAGSFVGAAEALNISQTAVSARIRVLEEQLERPVFVRNKAGARLTPAGEKFLPFASSLVRVWETARNVVALPPGRSVLVSLGAELSLWSPLLSRWLLWMHRECPEIAVRATIDTGEHLLALMQEGGLDAAVIYGAQRRPGLVAELLFEERLVFARTPAQTGANEIIGIDWGADFAASLRLPFLKAQVRRSRSVMAPSPWTTSLQSAAPDTFGRASSGLTWRMAGCRSCPTVLLSPIQPILCRPRKQIRPFCGDCVRACALLRQERNPSRSHQ